MDPHSDLPLLASLFLEGVIAVGMGADDYKVHHRATPSSPPAESRSDGVVPIVRLRVCATWRVLDQDWAEVMLMVEVKGQWLPLSSGGLTTLLVARRYSGTGMDIEVPEFTLASALKKYLVRGGAVLLDFSQSGECYCHPTSQEVTWYYWATLGSRVSVALEFQPDESVIIRNLM